MKLPLKKIDSPSTPPLLTQRLTTQETLSRNLAGNRMENVSWKNTRSEKPCNEKEEAKGTFNWFSNF